MYLTILHGHVKKENRRSLEESYRNKSKHPPEGLLESFLAHSDADKSEWKIITLWQSEEAYHSAKDAGMADTCENLLCDAGSTPERSNYDIGGRYFRAASF